MSSSNSPEDPSIFRRIANIFSSKHKKLDLVPLKPESLDDKKQIVSHMVEVYNLTASDIAVPRADIIAIEVSAKAEEIVEVLTQHPHSYYPVYKTSLDNLIGFFAARDLIKNVKDVQTFVLREYVRDAMVVSPSTSVLDVLHKMRLLGQRIALIADEYGGVNGIITAEDIVEKVIGRMEESEREEFDNILQENDDKSIFASARVTVEEFEDRYGEIFSPSIKDEDIETLGGLVFFLAGHIPTRNEIIQHPNGVEFQVLDCNARYIKTMMIRNVPRR